MCLIKYTNIMIDDKFLLILGVGRSGTSLLQSMFAAHPSVSYLPESAFLRRYVADGVLLNKYKSEGEEGVVRSLEEDLLFSRLGIDAVELVREAVNTGELLDLALYRLMMESYNQGERSWVGDKDPRLIEFVPLVSTSFPHAKVINIIRDPRDVLLSKKKAAWSRKGHVWKHIFANRVQLKLGRNAGNRLLGTNYHEVIYEDLIASPRRVLATLCEKLDLPFDEAMLAFGEAAKKLVSERELSWKKETIGPLLPENKEKWKTGLHCREIVLTELCCQKALRAGGYRSDDRKCRLSLLDKLWVFSGAAVILMADWPYRLFRNFKVWRACKRVG